MVDVEALEHIPEPRQLSQSAVAHRPVGQHARQRWEYVESAAHAGIGREECGHHDIGTVAVYATVGGVEGLSRERGAGGVDRTGILGFDAVTEGVERVAELLEGGRVEAVGGFAYAAQGALERDGSHRECAALCGGVAPIHVLYALGTALGAVCHEVYLQVAHRLEGESQLHILGQVGGGGRGHRVAHEQPVVALRLVDVAVVYHAEGEVESWRQESVPARLSERIAHGRHKSRQRERVVVAVAEAHVAHHHHHAGYRLSRLVPALVLERFARGHRQLDFGERVDLAEYLDLVITHLFIFYGDVLAVLGLGAYVDTACALAVAYEQRGVGRERQLALIAASVLGQFFLLLLCGAILAVGSLLLERLALSLLFLFLAPYL